MVFKKLLVILFLFILISGITFLMFSNVSLTGETIRNEYTFTKAVCDENNLCKNYEIKCRGNQIVYQIPIQGSEMQYPENWRDPRTNEQKEKLCE